MSAPENPTKVLIAKTDRIRHDLLEAADKLAVYADALAVEANRLKRMAQEQAERPDDESGDHR